MFNRTNRKKMFLYVILTAVCTFVLQTCYSSEDTKTNLLNGNAIDLLVGTPTGVDEPLDKRRDQIKKVSIDTDKYLSEWEQIQDQGNLEWENAEENDTTVSESKIESEYLDLIADISSTDCEKTTNASQTFKQNLSNSVATDKQL